MPPKKVPPKHLTINPSLGRRITQNDFFFQPQSTNNPNNQSQLELLLGSHQATLILPTTNIQQMDPTNNISQIGQSHGQLNNGISQSQGQLPNDIGQTTHLPTGQAQQMSTVGNVQSQGTLTNTIGQCTLPNSTDQSHSGSLSAGIGQLQGILKNGTGQPQVQANSGSGQVANSNDNLHRTNARSSRQQAPPGRPRTVRQLNQRRAPQPPNRRPGVTFDPLSHEMPNQSIDTENIQVPPSTLQGAETSSFSQFFSSPFTIPQEQPTNQNQYDNLMGFQESSQSSFEPANNEPQATVNVPLQTAERNVFLYPEDLSGHYLSALPSELITRKSVTNYGALPHGYRTHYGSGHEIMPYGSYHHQRYVDDHFIGYGGQSSKRAFPVRDDHIPPYYITTASQQGMRIDDQPQEYFMSSRRQQIQHAGPLEDMYIQRMRPPQAQGWASQGGRQHRGIPPPFQPNLGGGNMLQYRRGQRNQQSVWIPQRPVNQRPRAQGLQQFRGVPFQREEQMLTRRGNPPMGVSHQQSMSSRPTTLDAMLTDFGALYPDLKPQIMQEFTPHVVQLVDLGVANPSEGTQPSQAPNSLPFTYALFLTPNNPTRGAQQPAPTPQATGQEGANNGEVTSTNVMEDVGSGASSPNLVIDCDEQEATA